MKFNELIFEYEEYPSGKTGRARYQVEEYIISIIKGFGVWADEKHPYELWVIEPECHSDPYGYLTEEDVENFINGKFYERYDEFYGEYLRKKEEE